MAYYLQNPRMAWTEEEDQCLRAAVERYGVKRWAQIAALLPGRTSKACSHRWRTYLQPGVMHTSTNPFTEWEVAVVKEAHKVLGNNWSAIARMLPGRTNAAVKNFWYAHKRRSQRARGRGHVVRQAGTADSADPASTADPDDEDLGDNELDADIDFGELDDADADLDFGDEGDLGCEDLDDDDELLHDEMAEHEHLVQGTTMHGTAYDMAGIPLMGSWKQNASLPASCNPQQQQAANYAPGSTFREKRDSMQELPTSSETAHQSPAIAVVGSAHASPTTPTLRATDASTMDTPGHHSSSCGHAWSPEQQQHSTSTAAQPASPGVPPTRESAAGVPPGTASVRTFLGSPVIPPNGHSCAGAPPSNGTVAGPTQTPAGPGYVVPTVVSPDDHQSAAAAAAAVQARISEGNLIVGTIGDLDVQDLADADMALSGDVDAELAMMRNSSGCLVDVHVPGASISHSSFLDDHLLPFSPATTHTSYQQQRLSNSRDVSSCQIRGVPSHALQCTSNAATGALQHGHWGISELADSPQLQLQIGQKRRVSQLHGYASQIAGHSRFCAAPAVAAAAANAHAGPSPLAGHGSNSSNSTWGGNLYNHEQQQLRQQYCSDSGVASSLSGHDSMFPEPMNQWHQQQQQQEYSQPGEQYNIGLLHEQQTIDGVTAGTITAATVLAPGEQPVTPQQQQQRQQQQRPQHMAKRFCLDLSDEALAAERSGQQQV